MALIIKNRSQALLANAALIEAARDAAPGAHLRAVLGSFLWACRNPRVEAPSNEASPTGARAWAARERDLAADAKLTTPALTKNFEAGALAFEALADKLHTLPEG